MTMGALCLSASRRMPRQRSSEQPARMRSANQAFTRPPWVLLWASTVSSARSSASASVSLNMVFDGSLPIVVLCTSKAVRETIPRMPLSPVAFAVSPG